MLTMSNEDFSHKDLRNFSSSKNDQTPIYINNSKRKQCFKEEHLDYKELSEFKKGRHSFLPGEGEVSWKCDMI